MKRRFFLTLTIVPLLICSAVCPFNTLQDLQTYVSFYPEHPKSDNNDWTNPDFTSFYKNELTHSYVTKLLTKLSISKKPLWDVLAFKRLLEQVTEERLEKQATPNKIPESKKRLSVTPTSRCILFGDLHGALHSLTRDLFELKRLQIIDDNFTIIAPNTYLILLGDTIGRSPYSLEILHVLLLLMHKNPKTVIYLQGNHEQNGYWKNFSMRRSIKILFPNLDLEPKIDLFFSTLADTLVIKIKSEITGINSKASFGNYSEASPRESNPERLKTPTTEDQICCAYTKMDTSLLYNPNTKLIFFGEKRMDTLMESPGALFVGYHGGAAKWSLLSCPITTYQKFFHFYYDSFVELVIGMSVLTSKLILHNHDTRETDTQTVYKTTTYNPIFKHNIKNIEKRKIYTVGTTMSLSGITGPLGRENRAGLETALYVNNKKEGVTLIKPVIIDDGYEPKKALENVEKIIHNYLLNTIIIPTGTPTLAFYINKIKPEELSILFPYTGGTQFRKKDITNIIHVRASYADEVKASIAYLIKNGITRFAFFYQNDSYGKPIAKAAREELKKLGITTWLDLPHIKTQTNFQTLITDIKKQTPQAIGCFSSHFPTQEFINQLGTEFFPGKALFGVSFLYSDAFQNFLETRGIEFVLSSAVPDPNTSTLDIAKEFRRYMKKRGLNINANSFEGYLAGTLLAEAINNTPKPCTKEKIMHYFENMRQYKFKGLTLTFNPETRDLSQPVWLRTLDNTWIAKPANSGNFEQKKS